MLQNTFQTKNITEHSNPKIVHNPWPRVKSTECNVCSVKSMFRFEQGEKYSGDKIAASKKAILILSGTYPRPASHHHHHVRELDRSEPK